MFVFTSTIEIPEWLSLPVIAASSIKEVLLASVLIKKKKKLNYEYCGRIIKGLGFLIFASNML